MAYIKSYSNYVLKRKHQNINSGTIYERDITTIGGLNQFAKGQIPIYKSSNFIITVNNESKVNRNFINDSGWEKNGSEDIWTLSNINESNGVESAEKTLKIVLKQDYYKLRDFAYFGSCVELIRASVIDIVNRFPGELYVPSIEGNGIPVFYNELGVSEPKRLGDDYGGNWVLVDNPHNINIHTSNVIENEIENKLKYLCLSYKDYGLETMPNITEYACVNGEHTTLTNEIKKNISSYKISKLGVGAKVADVNINGISIGAFVGNNGEIVYLTQGNLNKHVLTPIEKVQNDFFDSLDNFQKILMNKDSNPKYSVIFEVTSENSFGYVNELKTFTFPTTFGGYNLAVNNSAFNMYVNSLQQYAEFYDEYFCDNIWRSMTHESIKNFDWTYTREYGVGEEEEYVFGGTRMQKTLRLIGREFDEIKTYIDALKNYQMVDYGKGNAIPDYFLTDVVIEEGWDVENIYPYNNNLKQVQFLENVKITPYSKTYIHPTQQNGYFYKCGNNCTGKPSLIEAIGANANISEIYDDCLKIIRHKIIQYINEKEYSMSDVNNHFMKMLKLNSKNIFRKKGTIQGIETLLSLFGLKSKRWCEKYNNFYKQYKNNGFTPYVPDYEIKEYVTISNKLKGQSDTKDIWVSSGKNMNNIDWYNSTKTVGYDTEDYRNGIYYSYQGLPVRSYIKDGDEYYNTDRLPIGYDLEGKNRYLYPYFSPYKLIDGKPYYQMYGGWINKYPKTFDVKNQEVNADDVNKLLFKETYRNLRTVNDIKELINLPKTFLKNGDICFVNDTKGDYALIDGVVYDIFKDNKGSYIRTYMRNNSAKVGNKLFASELTVSLYNDKTYRHVFSEYKENTEIRIYINSNKQIIVYGKYYGINNVSFYKNGIITNTYEGTSTVGELSNCFKLKNVNNKNEINDFGWTQLTKDSIEYKKINTIIDDFKGNNPHTGHMNYDGGKEYLSYFSTLFKYALEQNQFNEKCYGDGFFEEIQKIEKIGFEGLDCEKSDSCPYCYKQYEDSKIHYFGNSINSGGTKSKVDIKTAYDNNSDIKSILDNTNISDQIINIKRVDINFFGKNRANPIIKYIDNIIMNYLEQVLPSTLIINVNYCA